jgi:nitroimidazol reductase NimA-like FMN-containing flavoprotein (pyridoxamine 5'-phosphate oxidase superfamily)
MRHVITELDQRFSAAGAQPVSWEDTERVLREAQLFWISTVRRDGRPHVTPLVAIWDDGSLYFSTGPQEQKAVNLEANAQVALTTGCNRWQDGVDVVVEGAAERVTDAAKLSELARAWEGRWDGSWKFEPVEAGFRHAGGDGIAYVFAVRPTKVLAFGKGRFSHTRHRFAEASDGAA